MRTTELIEAEKREKQEYVRLILEKTAEGGLLIPQSKFIDVLKD